MTPDDWFIERIEDYLDGDLPEGEREEMERRVTANPACRAEIEEAERFRSLAREAGPIPIPDELGARIRERMARERPTGRGRVVLLRRLVTAAVAAAIIFLILDPIGPFEPDPAPTPAEPVARLGNPGTPSPLAVSDLLEAWLAQARNVAPGDAELLFEEARELALLTKVRSRLAVTRGPERTYLLAAEDLLIQVENGISPDAFPMEAEMVAMARN